MELIYKEMARAGGRGMYMRFPKGEPRALRSGPRCGPELVRRSVDLLAAWWAESGDISLAKKWLKKVRNCSWGGDRSPADTGGHGGCHHTRTGLIAVVPSPL